MDIEALVYGVNDLYLRLRAPQRLAVDIGLTTYVADQMLEVLTSDEQLDNELAGCVAIASDYRNQLSTILESPSQLRAFGWAEQRLLVAHGVLDGAAAFLIDKGFQLMRSGAKIAELRAPTREGINQFRQRLPQHPRRGRQRPPWVRRALYIGGGCLMMGIDGSIGTGSAVVSGGLTGAGVAISIGIGGALVGKGLG